MVKRFWIVALPLFLAVAGASAEVAAQPISSSSAPASEPLPPPDAAALAYVRAHAQAPEDYVLSLFKDHDVVYLGEAHRIRQNLEFLQRLVPRLHAAGIHDLAYEMALNVEQGAVDALVGAPAYDEEKALTLMFHWGAVDGWAFREYADVFRAAWRANQGRGKSDPRFRVTGIDYRPDWALVKPGDRIMDRVTRWRAWAGSNQIARNVTMADLVLREFVAKGRKVLVFGGYGHTSLVPTLDTREESGMRFSAAHLMRRRIGDRITTVRLAPARTGVPALDAVLAALPPDRRAVGFALRRTPAGALPLPEASAARLVVEGRTPTVADEMEGLVHFGEAEKPVTLVSAFLTDDVVARAKKEGFLPDVPEITVAWLVQRATGVPPKPAASAAP